MREKLASVLFGGSCFLCRGAARTLLCAQCDAELPRLEHPLCPRCALESPGGAICGRCLTHSPAYDATYAALKYDFPADALVHALKFRGELALCERTRDAPPQIELPYGERQRNVRGAFRCTRSVDGARIAVVDDVMTTGATLDEIARTLKAAGAAHVENWVVTRTPLHA